MSARNSAAIGNNRLARLSLVALPLAAGLVASHSARGDVLVTYDPTGINGSSASPSAVAATSISAAVNPTYSSDLSATSLTAGGSAMLAITAAGASNNSQMFNGLVSEVNSSTPAGTTDTLAHDYNGGAGYSYYTFSIAPTPGQTLNISAIDLSGNFYTSSNTGYPTFALESSLTGFGSTTGASGNVLAQFSIERDTAVTGPPINTSYGASVMTPYQGANTYSLSGDSDVSSSYTGVTISPTDVVNLSGVSAFQGVSGPVEFRLYVYSTGNGTSGLSGKYFGIGGSGSGDATSTDNAIVVDGTVSGAPEPSSIGTVICGGLTALGMRRRRRAAD